MSKIALLPDVEPFIPEPTVASVSFNGARLRQPITYKTIHGVPIHIYAQEHPCPSPSYPAPEQRRVEPSLRHWAKSTKGYPTDPNYLCKDRCDRHVYCGGVVLPASQTGVVWHLIGLHGDEHRLRFHHIDDDANLSEPSVLRCEEEPHVNFGSTREDIQATTELGRKYVERLRHDYEMSEAANRRVGINPKWTPELQKEWAADIIRVLDKPAEIIKVKVERKLAAAEQQARAYSKESVREYKAGYCSQLFTEDEQGDPGFDRASDYIANYGQRDTKGDHPNHHQERKHWFPFFRAILNEEGWNAIEYEWGPEGFTAVAGRTPEREAEIRNHPRFRELVALYQVLFSGRSIEELDIDKDPNAVAKLLDRAKDIRNPLDSIPESERQKAIGNYVCTIVLNNRAMLKILAPLDAPFAEAATALKKDRLKTRRKAIDNAKQDAKARGLGKNATEALIVERVERIDKAYGEALIMEDRGLTINDLDDPTPADVIFSTISRGQLQHPSPI